MSFQEVIQFLCQRPRPTGSTHNASVRKFISSRLTQFGYEVKSQEHPFVGWELVNGPRVRFIEPVTKDIETIPVVWSPPIESDEVLGRIVAVGTMKTFEAYPWQRFALMDNEDNIAAYLITREDRVWAQPLDSDRETIPHIIVDTQACKEINDWLSEGHQVRVAASLKCRYVPDLKICNLVASLSAHECRLVIGAHYDSMFNTVGAHDNASGIAALLSVATSLPESVEFVAFDAEEWNKFGAYSYVEAAKQRGALQRIELMINIDSVGVGDFIYVLVSPQLESKVQLAVNNMEVSKQTKIEITAQEEFPQFDSWPFMKNGVPVIQIGTRGDPPFEYFHHPKDTPDNIKSGELIDKSARLVSGLIDSFLS